MSKVLQIIEFAGLPGSGKSTITRALETYYKEQAVRSATLEEIWKRHSIRRKSAAMRLLHVLSFYLRTPRRLATFLCLSLSIRPFSPNVLKRSCKLAYLLFRIEFSRRVAERKAVDVFLLEEGVFQAIWSIQLYGQLSNEKALEVFLRAFRVLLPTHLIFVVVDSSVAVDRVASRISKGCRFDAMDQNCVTSIFTRNESFLYCDLKRFAMENGVWTNDVFGEAPIQEIVAKLTTV